MHFASPPVESSAEEMAEILEAATGVEVVRGTHDYH